MTAPVRISPVSSPLPRSIPPWKPSNTFSLQSGSTPNSTSLNSATRLCLTSTGAASRIGVMTASSTDGGPLQELESAPMAVDLLPICSEYQFDQVVSEAQRRQEPLIVVWMASWCRKCIYLKPKLEKLAAEYHPRLRFFCVDVNKVSYKLVERAGITKMPIIQLWKNGQKQAEVLGGHKAHLVVNEVREMIENENDGV